MGFYNYFHIQTLASGKVNFKGALFDPSWWNAVWNTVRFAVLSVVFETILGLGVALMLNADFKGRGIVRAAILIPWAIPTIVSAKMWAWMLNDQYGIINDILFNAGLIDHKIAWTSDSSTAMIAVLAVDIWKTTPFMALLILAGLQTVPGDIYEAAKIDGEHPVKVFWKLTLPLIRPALMVAVRAGLYELVRFLGIYNTPWAMIMSYTIFTLPFTVWVLTTFMRDLPAEIEEAAIIDGASPWVIITQVFLPLLWPALVTTGLLAFIGAWNEFLFALTFTISEDQRTTPVAIALLSGASTQEIPWGPIMAASVVVTIPLVVLVLVFQRKIVAGLTAGGVKG